MNRQKLNRLNKLAEKIGNGNQEETNQAFEEMMGIYKNEFRLIISFWAQRKNYSLDIKAFDEHDLSSLFNNFCKENSFPRNTVTGVTVVASAVTMEELQEIDL